MPQLLYAAYDGVVWSYYKSFMAFNEQINEANFLKLANKIEGDLAILKKELEINDFEGSQ